MANVPQRIALTDTYGKAAPPSIFKAQAKALDCGIQERAILELWLLQRKKGLNNTHFEYKTDFRIVKFVWLNNATGM
jgi:hypothetical protein